jgi:hypothetical protein
MLQFHKIMNRTCSTPKKKITQNVLSSERELRIERFMTAGFATRPLGEVGSASRNRFLADKMIVWRTILGLIMAGKWPPPESRMSAGPDAIPSIKSDHPERTALGCCRAVRERGATPCRKKAPAAACICELLVNFDLPCRMIRPVAQGASAWPSIFSAFSPGEFETRRKAWGSGRFRWCSPPACRRTPAY